MSSDAASMATSCCTCSRGARREAGTLKGPVVGTVMSNLGLEHALAEARHRVSARAGRAIATCSPCCSEVGGTLGGETSGHILCLDKTTTGDGLISALQVLAVMKSTGASLAELCAPMPKYPAGAAERARGAALRSR